MTEIILHFCTPPILSFMVCWFQNSFCLVVPSKLSWVCTLEVFVHQNGLTVLNPGPKQGQDRGQGQDLVKVVVWVKVGVGVKVKAGVGIKARVGVWVKLDCIGVKVGGSGSRAGGGQGQDRSWSR